jgi:predicted nucleotide-binding protein
MPKDFWAFRRFLKAARGRSQEEIIIEFLASTVLNDSVSENGSVLINHPQKKVLITFNEGDFLFEKKLLDPQTRGSWPAEIGYYDSIAGICFRTEEPQTYCRAENPTDSRFFGDSPIANMVCIPIMTGGSVPFGVVCFHNNKPAKTFSQEHVKLLESCVDVLAIALHNPIPELNLERNVFIVHGRDRQARLELENMLLQRDVTPRVLEREDKGPNSILEELESLIRICRAGFILVTPDDEGRFRGGDEPLAGRARQNVIFETGLLFAKFRAFERVALVVKRPLELPSDLNGIFYLEFTSSVQELEKPIEKKLDAWLASKREVTF